MLESRFTWAAEVSTCDSDKPGTKHHRFSSSSSTPASTDTVTLAPAPAICPFRRYSSENCGREDSASYGCWATVPFSHCLELVPCLWYPDTAPVSGVLPGRGGLWDVNHCDRVRRRWVTCVPDYFKTLAFQTDLHFTHNLVRNSSISAITCLEWCHHTKGAFQYNRKHF